MSDEEYRRRWSRSMPSKTARHDKRGLLVATTSVPIGDAARFKALAAARHQTVSILFQELIAEFLESERANAQIPAPEPIKGRRATVSTSITVDDQARLLAIAKREWVAVGTVLRQLITEALSAGAS